MKHYTSLFSDVDKYGACTVSLIYPTEIAWPKLGFIMTVVCFFIVFMSSGINFLNMDEI